MRSCSLKIGVVFAFGVLTSWVPAAQAASTSACGPLAPPPPGTAISVTPSDDLSAIVANAQPGTTILLQDGEYLVVSLMFTKPNVTLRSASGNRDAVILDNLYSLGPTGAAGEPIRINASYVTIADITIERAYNHLIHLGGGGHNARLHNLRLVDSREQFVKINPSADGLMNDFGKVTCSSFELTEAGRGFIEANPTSPFLTCYTGGIDAQQAWGWEVRDSTFKDIYCTNGGLAEHAVHFWKTSRDITVERNYVENCARGIGFGLGTVGGDRIYPDNPLAGTKLNPKTVGHIGGLIRNNIIWANIGSRFDVGIGLEQAHGVKVYHNTVFANNNKASSIDSRYRNSDPVIKNNLTNMPMTVRDRAHPTFATNITVAPASWFVDATNGNLHLVGTATAAIDKGSDLRREVPDDFDGNARDNFPDIGADEYP